MWKLYALHELLIETQSNYHDVHYAFILDDKQNIIAHTFGDGFPPNLVEANAVKSLEYQKTVVIQTSDFKVWDVAVPIFDCSRFLAYRVRTGTWLCEGKRSDLIAGSQGL